MRRILWSCVTLLSAMAATSLAGPIAVPNFSFEEPDVPDGGTSDVVPGWDGAVGTNATVRLYDPLSTHFPGATGDNAPLPGTAHGGQSVVMASSQYLSFGNLTSPPLGTIAANTRYTLTVALGRPVGGHMADVVLSLTANGNPAFANANVFGGGGVAPGTFSDVSVSNFPALWEGHPLVGAELRISLHMVVRDSGFYGVYFDNVRLTETVLPEPSAGGLVAAFALAALLRRHRSTGTLYPGLSPS
jgi:hypothetical protein